MTYTLDDFRFDLPEELIAQEPTVERAESRLLIARDREVKHTHVSQLLAYLPSRSLLVMNNSKVIPARLFATTPHGGKVEIFLVQRLEKTRWMVLAKPFKKLKAGSKYSIPGDQHLVVESLIDRGEDELPLAEVRFELAGQELSDWLDQHAHMPLPPYIKRTNPQDKERYQTVYAKDAGSVAAPTAGLHFDQNLLTHLRSAGHEIQYVQLHVGGGTFFPVKKKNFAEHQMHEEEYSITRGCFDAIVKAKEEQRAIIVVGTTSLRALESLGKESNHDLTKARELCNRALRTSIYIYPQQNQLYRPWFGDALFTNFHQPESSLILLVSAIFGRERIFSIYEEAIRQRYRFFSYGDASLLWM